jgi:hypothetical protein
MNDLEIMLLAIGDLEFTRRKLSQRIQELESEKAESAEDKDGRLFPATDNASQHQG